MDRLINPFSTVNFSSPHQPQPFFQLPPPFPAPMKKLSLTLALLTLAGGVAWWSTRTDRELQLAPSTVASSNPPARSKPSRVANSEAALAERLKAAKEISTNLTNEELKQLIAFLSKPVDERNRENDLLAINEVMNRLRTTGLACGEYATALCGLIRDPKVHPVVRDYAIQHAFQWMRDAHDGNFAATLAVEDRRRLLDCTVAFLHDSASLHETGYGTALNVLRTLESAYPEEAAAIFEQCEPRIFEVASGRESAPLANRVSAIQALPALPGREAGLSLVRGLTADVPTGSPVRLVAIATLGEFGEQADLTTLRQLETTDRRVAYAARAAATRLEASLLSASR
jgi:hypothetical protein